MLRFAFRSTRPKKYIYDFFLWLYIVNNLLHVFMTSQTGLLPLLFGGDVKVSPKLSYPSQFEL